jgi:AcrR family transcriptional regulator
VQSEEKRNAGKNFFEGNFGNIKCFLSFVPHFMNEANGNKERILKAAQELFFSYGIRSITMDDIARHLSMSKKTIYQYFEDKDQIVYTLMQDDFEQRVKSMKEVTDQSKDAVDEILQSMDMMHDFFSALNPNVIYDIQKFHPQTWEVFRRFREHHIQRNVEANLRRGIKQGYYRTDINVPAIARLRIQEVEMGMDPHIYSPQQFKVNEVELALLDHFLFGILTLKGLKKLLEYRQHLKNKKTKQIA